MRTEHVNRLRDLLAWATDEHEKALRGEWSAWDQSSYASSRHCIAGELVQRDCWEPMPYCATWVRKGARQGWIPCVAAELVGLTYHLSPDRYSAYGLFLGDNAIDDLWDIANVLSNGAIEAPARYRAEVAA